MPMGETSSPIGCSHKPAPRGLAGHRVAALALVASLRGGPIPKHHHACCHREKVAFGKIVQLVLAGARRATMHEVLRFSTAVGLPVTLGEIGCDGIEGNCCSTSQPALLRPGEPFTTNRSK